MFNPFKRKQIINSRENLDVIMASNSVSFRVVATDKDSSSIVKIEVSGLESEARVGSLSIHAGLFVNEGKIGENFDVHQVFVTLGKSGMLPLFTCACGHFGCGGGYVDVIWGRRIISLKNLYKPYDVPSKTAESLAEQFEHAISRDTWGELLQNLLDELSALVNKKSLTNLTIGASGINLCENLELYKSKLNQFQLNYTTDND